MPIKKIIYKCLLISPSDVAEERESLMELINRWNAHVGGGLGVAIDLVRWETHSVPDMSLPAQEAINRQLVKDCDLGIAIFWSKLGKATVNHSSGSTEEIYELLQKGSRVLVYFCNRPIPQAALVDDQFPRLQEAKKRFQEQGLYAEYSDVKNLRELVQLHLTNIITDLVVNHKEVGEVLPASKVVSTPNPSIRVEIIFTYQTGALETGMFLGVVVKNESPFAFFLRGVAIELKDGRIMWIPKDAMTGVDASPRTIAAGKDRTIYTSLEGLRKYRDKVSCAIAIDETGHEYRSNPDFFTASINNFLGDYL